MRTEADLEMIGNKKAKEVDDDTIWQWISYNDDEYVFTQVIFKEDGQLIETRLQQVFQVCML